MDHFFFSDNGWYLSDKGFGASKANPIIQFLIEELVNNDFDRAACNTVGGGRRFLTNKLQWHPDLMLLPGSAFAYDYDENDVCATEDTTVFGVIRKGPLGRDDNVDLMKEHDETKRDSKRIWRPLKNVLLETK
jgi:hypothetical protein